jgi:hypothetical protein
MSRSDNPYSNFEDPVTRWPDFDWDMPPRPSVVVMNQGRWRRDRRLTSREVDVFPLIFGGDSPLRTLYT